MRAFLVAFCVLVPVVASGQAPEGSDRMSLLAVADSVHVLKQLDDTVRHNPKNAGAWYRRGMVAWSLYERSLHVPPPHGLYWQSLTGVADTSLRNALELDPANEKYFAAVAHFLLQSGVTFRTYGAYGVFNDELARVRKSGDAAAVSRAALEAARLYWLRYDRLVCRAVIYGEGLPAPALEAPGQASVQNLRGAHRVDIAFDYAGEIDYLKTELLLREAYDDAPADPRAFRQLAMLLADHRRWHELATFARDHITRAPRDGWGFMVMGLAQHRIGNARVSAAAFDSAFAVLGDSVRKFLDRFERTLDTGQLHAFVANAPVAQKKIEASYWRNADPLWSVDGTEPRAEYLARVTFAQLRWGSDELTLDGVTSDFGNLYVRNGKWNAGWDGSFYFWRPSEVPADARQDICVPQVKPWFFAGDTRVPEGPAANWGSLAHGPIDSIQTQVARFRAAADSTDIFLATMPPIALIQRAASVKGPARSDLWLLANGTDDVAHDSVLPALPGVKTFIRRVSPGMYVYRTESSADGAVVTARATAGFIAGDDPRTGFSSRGFGMSDVLLASRVNAAPGAKRWSDYSVTPLVGPAIRKSSVTIVWENYELGSTNGGASYTVTINIRQADTTKTLSGRIAAAVVGGIGSAIGVNRAKDRVEFTYDRSAPLAPVIADNITLSLNDTPAGKYLLTLRITDKATGKSAGRSQQLVIVDPSARPPVRR